MEMLSDQADAEARGKKMRYRYINKAYIKSGAAHGVDCDPVITNGKCVVGRGNQLVIFENGTRAIVVRRCLRVQK
jgi:hypothetical protein